MGVIKSCERVSTISKKNLTKEAADRQSNFAISRFAEALENRTSFSFLKKHKGHKRFGFVLNNLTSLELFTLLPVSGLAGER